MGRVSDTASSDPDLLVDFRDVTLVRGGKTLVGPIDWQVELDERWVIIGPNGAGKTSLLRMAAAELHPSSGTAYLLNEPLGRVEVRELSTRIGVSSPGLADRVPDDEVVSDVVISAGYSVIGRWREDMTTSIARRPSNRSSRWAPSISPTGDSARCRRASVSAVSYTHLTLPTNREV